MCRRSRPYHLVVTWSGGWSEGYCKGSCLSGSRGRRGRPSTRLTGRQGPRQVRGLHRPANLDSQLRGIRICAHLPSRELQYTAYRIPHTAHDQRLDAHGEAHAAAASALASPTSEAACLLRPSLARPLARSLTTRSPLAQRRPTVTSCALSHNVALPRRAFPLRSERGRLSRHCLLSALTSAASSGHPPRRIS